MAYIKATQEDLSLGLQVHYKSRSGEWIQTEVEDTSVSAEGTVRLKAKHKARLDSIYLAKQDGEAEAGPAAAAAIGADNAGAPTPATGVQSVMSPMKI